VPILTTNRAHQHSLGLPRRRLPTSPRLRHLIFLLEQHATCPRTPTPLQDRPRPSGRCRFRARERKDTSPRCSEAASRSGTRQRCAESGEKVGRATWTREPDCAVARRHNIGAGGRDGGSARAAEQTPGKLGCVRTLLQSSESLVTWRRDRSES
jgi:hypothetical protein